jgi:DNA polymerase-1
MIDRKKKRIILLDSHAIIHRAYHALPDFVSSKGEPTGGIYGLSAMLLKIISDLKPDYIFACYDLPGPTYRHEAYSGYKAKREKAEDDLIMQLKRSRDVFTAFNIPIYDAPGFEADDILGTIVEDLITRKERKDFEIIIASGDMDTLQLVKGKDVKVFTMKKGLSETILYDEDKVKERFGFEPKMIPDYKGLSGDPSDNIPGVKGVGDKTATTLITNFGTIENIYKTLKKNKKALLDAGIKERIIKLLEENEEEAAFSKELATIRKDAPIHLVLAEKPWKETVDFAKVRELFAELEFRTMAGRAIEALGLDEEDGIETGNKKEEIVKEEVDEIEKRQIFSAVSLLYSSITDPQLEDVYRISKKNSFSEAKNVILSELKNKKLLHVYEKIEKPLVPVIGRMEKCGVKVDKDHLKELSFEYHKKLTGLEKKIYSLSGLEFNINSPKQLGDVLFNKMGLKVARQKKTSLGALSTRESELEKLIDEHPIIQEVLHYRELQKLLSTYIDTIPTLIAPDGRLHTTFLPNGAATGRMASRDPNLQNIPHKSEAGARIREAFVAEKGYRLVAFDYSQIELRIAAFLSKDRKLLDIFNKGEDVHTSVASEVFNVVPADVTKEMRRQAKVINFGIIYGMGVTSLAKAISSDRATAQKFYDEYFKKFSGLASYLDDIKNFAYKNGYTETFFGRRRYFEGLKSKLPYVRAQSERMAINAPIQGTEADIIKIAMVKIDDHVTKLGLGEEVRMLLQVHDELVFEIKENEISRIAPDIKKIMEESIDPKEISGIVCVAEGKAGPNWGKMDKII